MNLIDIIIIALCVVFSIFVIIKSIINKKKGKTSCGCNCSNCQSCALKRKNDEK